MKKGSRGVRYLTEREAARMRGEVDPLEDTIEIVLGNGIQEFRAALAAKERGFSLLDTMLALTVAAIVSLSAMPSMIRHLNLSMLQATANAFRFTYQQVPALPLDPTWTKVGNTYTKVLTRPAGTISITVPVTIGGSYVCGFSDASYTIRCP